MSEGERTTIQCEIGASSSARGERFALLAAMVPLVLGPLAISNVLADIPTAQKHVVIFSVVSAWIVRVVLTRRGIRIAGVCDAWVAAYALAIGLSVAVSPEKAFSIRAALFPLVLIGYYFLLTNILVSIPASRRIIVLMIAVGVVVAGIGVLQSLGLDLVPYMERHRTPRRTVLSTLGNPNFVASFLGPICFLVWVPTIEMGTGKRARIRRIVFGAMAILLLACIIMSGGRGVWIGLFCATVFIAVVLIVRGKQILPSRTRRDFVRLGIAVVFLTAVLAGTLFVISNRNPGRGYNLVQHATSRREARIRFFYWGVADEMIRDHPWVGFGYGRFSSAFWPQFIEMMKDPQNAPYREYVRRVYTEQPSKAHNEYIETAVEMGFVGLAAFLGMILWFVVLSLRIALSGDSTPKPRRVQLLLTTGALLVILVDAMFSFPLHLPASGLLFWTLMALIRNDVTELGSS